MNEYNAIMEALHTKITAQYGSLAAFSKATGIGGQDGKTLSRNFRHKAGRHLSLSQFLAICRALGLSEMVSPSIGECFCNSSNFTPINLTIIKEEAAKTNAIDKTCLACGSTFQAQAPSASFCSGRCRVAAHRAKAKLSADTIKSNPDWRNK